MGVCCIATFKITHVSYSLSVSIWYCIGLCIVWPNISNSMLCLIKLSVTCRFSSTVFFDFRYEHIFLSFVVVLNGAQMFVINASCGASGLSCCEGFQVIILATKAYRVLEFFNSFQTYYF